MDIPFSFQTAYDEEYALLDRVRYFAERRLRGLCKRKGWLFDDRMKEPESVLAKLQLGELRTISEMQDFYGAMVVTPSPVELDEATREVLAEFRGGTRKPPRVTDPDVFRYDDIHVIASLGPLGPVAPRAALTRNFEVQIRTGLQYAWWRATHDEIYKPGEAPDWRLRRVAGQLRASLELVDGALGNLRTTATLLEQRDPDEADLELSQISALLERWAPDRRPVDVYRFSETVLIYLEASEATVDALEELLDADAAARLVGDVTITPAQGILAILVEENGVGICDRLGTRDPRRYALITEEMEAACPFLSSVPDGQRVQYGSGA